MWQSLLAMKEFTTTQANLLSRVESAIQDAVANALANVRSHIRQRMDEVVDQEVLAYLYPHDKPLNEWERAEQVDAYTNDQLRKAMDSLALPHVKSSIAGKAKIL
jgi:hypothetical protein